MCSVFLILLLKKVYNECTCVSFWVLDLGRIYTRVEVKRRLTKSWVYAAIGTPGGGSVSSSKLCGHGLSGLQADSRQPLLEQSTVDGGQRPAQGEGQGRNDSKRLVAELLQIVWWQI